MSGAAMHQAAAASCCTVPGLPPLAEASGVLDEKLLSTLRARAALAGWVLEVHTDGQGGRLFTASRWGKVRELASVGEVDRFLRQVDGEQR